ncbi:hypothetical protein ACFY7Y_00495 [Streptomyces virginiae]|uniref:hypothetical protein n=1 Tax=Streptomyces virginiae TaxID=1961 RepID=UPI0036C803D4
MQRTALVPYARLPREHHDRHVSASTVDVFGAAHWLLTERAPEPVGDVQPFDALVVSVDPYGDVELTELSAVRARWPRLDRLPDGGFVVAAARARRYEDADQVQVFDAFGGETTTFSIGDAVEHMLVDETGHVWAGHFDENPAGIRPRPPAGRRQGKQNLRPGRTVHRMGRVRPQRVTLRRPFTAYERPRPMSAPGPVGPWVEAGPRGRGLAHGCSMLSRNRRSRYEDVMRSRAWEVC